MAWLVLRSRLIPRRAGGGCVSLPHVSAEESARVSATFTRFGSDKADPHTYGETYASILSALAPEPQIVELGIGTTFTDVPCNMGERGVPGASLRAFRELRPDASVVGADVDRRVLFQEEGIRTLWVDQLDRRALASLRAEVGGERSVDLLIDDGLHSKRSNLNSLRELLPAVKPGGYYVIEDVDGASIAFWQHMLRSMRLSGEVLAMPLAGADVDINNLVVITA
jgi:hypothetical protein